MQPEAARQALAAALPPAAAEDPATGKIAFTPRAKKIMELAVREALKMGHNYIGTEHLLLGVLEDEERAGAGPLTGLDVTPKRAKQWLAAQAEAHRRGKATHGLAGRAG